MPEEKPKCPECQVELVLVNNEMPEKCEKCGFLIKGYQPFLRWFKQAQKDTTPAPEPKKKSSNPFASLSEL